MTTSEALSVDVGAGKRAHWSLEDIPFESIETAKISNNESLFYLLAPASLVESGSSIYTRNLVEHFAARPDLAAWLHEHWEPEEMQHGFALGHYVKCVWPRFDWQSAWESFYQEYSKLCTVQALGDGPLEMVARCVVEMGTSTYYQALRDLARKSAEPVLENLLDRIRVDEVGHYKHFLAYFHQFQQEQSVSRLKIMGTLKARLAELRDSDSDVALRHVWRAAHECTPALFPNGTASIQALRKRLFEQVGQCLPIKQSVHMTLKPLTLPPRLENMLSGPLSWLGQKLMF